MKRLLTIAAAVAAIVVAPTSAGAQSATPTISLIHGIPGTTVDLVVDGTVVLDAFAPGSIVDITSFAGRTLNNVEVVTDDTGDTVIGPVATLDVPATGNWSLVAHLDADGDATLSSFENNLADTDNDEARLTVRHTAEAPPVDLVIGDQRPVENAANGASAELELPSGALTAASVALAAGTPILEITGVTLAAQTNTIVHVVGSAEDDTLDVVVQVVQLPVAAAATTTTVAGETTTTTSPTPLAVNTGAPLSGSSSTTILLVIALGGLVLAGGSYLVRRRV
ncbi:MAG TPA: DUF4397 domain-containing protein [Ilumatobacter sp.]|nr:DUF4397 domain-containing protein [Ilumatobacter sp.]